MLSSATPSVMSMDCLKNRRKFQATFTGTTAAYKAGVEQIPHASWSSKMKTTTNLNAGGATLWAPIIVVNLAGLEGPPHLFDDSPSGPGSDIL